MRVKPRITRRADGRWIVHKPPVGFRPIPDETEHDNWRDAVGSLVDMSHYYAPGGSAERSYWPHNGIARVPAWSALNHN